MECRPDSQGVVLDQLQSTSLVAADINQVVVTIANGHGNVTAYADTAVGAVQAHILIFLIAACHLIWAILSSVMSMVALRRWNTYEAHIHGRGLLHMPVGGLQRHGEPAFVYGLRQCIRQFSHPVDEAQFGAIRELFIEFTKVGLLASWIRFAYLGPVSVDFDNIFRAVIQMNQCTLPGVQRALCSQTLWSPMLIMCLNYEGVCRVRRALILLHL